MKNLLAMALGLGATGVGLWRLAHGETTGGLVLAGVGLFLAVRGLTGRVRPGL